MDILSKIVTTIKAGVHEVGEAFVDSQALRILEQEIRDATEALNQSKDALVSIMARQKLAKEKIDLIQADIDEHEVYAEKALKQSNEDLAKDVAQRISMFESKLASEQTSEQHFANSVSQLRSAITHAEQNVQFLKSQLDMVRATENVQRAEAAVSERHSGSNSKLRTAIQSLERIKNKQAMNRAEMNAAQDLSGDMASGDMADLSLDERLEEAGIKVTNNADDVLERIRQKCNL